MKKLKKLKLSQLTNDELAKLQGGCNLTNQDYTTYHSNGTWTDRTQVWDYCSGSGPGYVS